MTGYYLRRLLLSMVTLFLITATVYAAMRLLPGNPTWSDEPVASPQIEAWLQKYHVREPIPVGYVRWLWDLARLDLGVSLGVQPGRPVSALVADALPYTLLLGCTSFTLTLVLAIPIGIASAWRPGSPGAKAGAGLLYALHALPAFWIALALQQLFGSHLGWLPIHGPAPMDGPEHQNALGTMVSAVPYWILPTAALTLGSLAFVIRFCRASLLEAMGEPYIRAARARGAGRKRILLRHALANTAVPLVSLTGLMLPGILSGSVLVEQIFALPGLGRLFFTAAGRRDYPVIMTLAVMTAVATLSAGLLADLMYRTVDPRVVLEDDGGEPG